MMFDLDKRFAEHVPTCLVSNEQIEAWRYAKGGSSIYGFEIVTSRFGIAVYGDIGSLTFTVGKKSYGIPFLAGDDVSYYIHSKLARHCQEEELDHENIRDVAVRHVCECWLGLDEFSDEIEESIKLPLDEIIGRVEQLAHTIDSGRVLAWLDDIRTEFDTCQEAMDWLQRIGIDEPWEHGIMRPTRSLMIQLEIVNYAAKKIIAARSGDQS